MVGLAVGALSEWFLLRLLLTGEQTRGSYDEAGKQTEGANIHEDGLDDVSARKLSVERNKPGRT